MVSSRVVRIGSAFVVSAMMLNSLAVASTVQDPNNSNSNPINKSGNVNPSDSAKPVDMNSLFNSMYAPDNKSDPKGDANKNPQDFASLLDSIGTTKKPVEPTPSNTDPKDDSQPAKDGSPDPYQSLYGFNPQTKDSSDEHGIPSYFANFGGNVGDIQDTWRKMAKDTPLIEQLGSSLGVDKNEIPKIQAVMEMLAENPELVHRLLSTSLSSDSTTHITYDDKNGFDVNSQRHSDFSNQFAPHDPKDSNDESKSNNGDSNATNDPYSWLYSPQSAPEKKDGHPEPNTFTDPNLSGGIQDPWGQSKKSDSVDKLGAKDGSNGVSPGDNYYSDVANGGSNQSEDKKDQNTGNKKEGAKNDSKDANGTDDDDDSKPKDDKTLNDVKQGDLNNFWNMYGLNNQGSKLPTDTNPASTDPANPNGVKTEGGNDGHVGAHSDQSKGQSQKDDDKDNSDHVTLQKRSRFLKKRHPHRKVVEKRNLDLVSKGVDFVRRQVEEALGAPAI